VACAALLFVPAGIAVGAPVKYKIGTTTGGVAVYYNDTNENPLNIAYFRAQAYNSITDVAGAAFAFSTEPIDPNYPAITPAAVFGDHGQFRFDMILEYPSNRISVPVLVGLDRTPAPDYDYNPTSLGSMKAAVNHYNGTTLINTLFKVDDGTATGAYESLGGGNWKVTFSGTLDTDGVVRWYSPGTPDTPFSSYGLAPWVEFSGELIYTRADDYTPGMDFYAGNIDFYGVPEPGTVGLLLLGGLVLAHRKR
jgi:hypothetical protein